MGSHYLPSVRSRTADETVQANPARHGLPCGCGYLGRIAKKTSRFPAPASACAGITYKSTRKDQADFSRQETHWSETLTSNSTFLMRR